MVLSILDQSIGDFLTSSANLNLGAFTITGYEFRDRLVLAPSNKMHVRLSKNRGNGHNCINETSFAYLKVFLSDFLKRQSACAITYKYLLILSSFRHPLMHKY